MTKKCILFLKELGLDASEVEFLLTDNALLESCTDEDIIANINLVISYGYPKADMATLLMVNPHFLLLSKETLEASLKAIDGDVEEALKENPYLI